MQKTKYIQKTKTINSNLLSMKIKNLYKIFLILLIITINFTNYAISEETNQKEAESLMFEAITFMNGGEFEKALTLIEKAIVLEPDNFEYQYERALANFKLKNYEKSIEELERLSYDPEANENVYQLLGASYDFLGKKENVFRILSIGLKKFPNSGRLYYELGVTEFGRQKEKNALENWEIGVNKDPNYSNNYYQLLRYYKNTDNKIWALLYSEVFLNISQNMQKSQEVSRTLYELYQNNLYKINNSQALQLDTIQTSDNESTNSDKTKSKNSKKKNKKKDAAKDLKDRNLANYGLRLTDKTNSDKLAIDINNLLDDALNNLLNIKQNSKYLNDDKLTIEGIIKLREEFIKLWDKSEIKTKFPIYLLNYTSKIIKESSFDTYSYFILAEGNPDEVEKWSKRNTKSVNNYIKWQSKNPFIVDKETNFTKYDLNSYK